mgnify:CR=1 FL=1
MKTLVTRFAMNQILLLEPKRLYMPSVPAVLFAEFQVLACSHLGRGVWCHVGSMPSIPPHCLGFEKLPSVDVFESGLSLDVINKQNDWHSMSIFFSGKDAESQDAIS